MRTRNSSINAIITICLIVLTAMVIITMDNNANRNFYEGLILLGCLIAFTASVLARESVEQRA